MVEDEERRAAPNRGISGIRGVSDGGSKSLQYQQNLHESKLRIIVFAAVSNRFEHIRPLLTQAMEALQEMMPGDLRIIRG